MLDAEPLRVVFESPPSAAHIAELAANRTYAFIELSFESEEIDSAGIAALVDAIDAWIDAGRRVRLIEAPQMLAHTLYKLGRLKNSESLAMSVRIAEPYAG